MKTKLLLLLLSGFTYFSCSAQFTTVGAKWYYGQVSFFEGLHLYSVYEAVGKDTIAGDIYTDIRTPAKKFYLLEDSSRVWYWNGTRKCLLFDRSINQGDTLIVDACFFSGFARDTTISLSIRIDSVYYIKDNMLDPLDSIKEWKLRDYSGFSDSVGYHNTGYFTDRVLQRQGGIYSLNLDELFIPISFDIYTYLRCFNSTAFNYRTSALGGKACDYINVGIIEKTESPSIFNIYPNPSSGKFLIESNTEPISKIRIFDSQGKLVQSVDLPKDIYSYEIDMAAPAKGFYYCSIITANMSYQCKLLLQQ